MPQAVPTNNQAATPPWRSLGVAARMAESHAGVGKPEALSFWGGIMNFSLSAPRRETFLVSAIIAVLVVIGMIVPLPFFTSYALGLLLIAYLILAAGVLIDGL
jgi:hypothetical protein